MTIAAVFADSENIIVYKVSVANYTLFYKHTAVNTIIGHILTFNIIDSMCLCEGVKFKIFFVDFPVSLISAGAYVSKKLLVCTGLLQAN